MILNGRTQTFNFVQQLKISKIVISTNFENLFEIMVYEAIKNITTDYRFNWMNREYERDKLSDDTGAFIACRNNADHLRVIRALDNMD